MSRAQAPGWEPSTRGERARKFGRLVGESPFGLSEIRVDKYGVITYLTVQDGRIFQSTELRPSEAAMTLRGWRKARRG